MARACVLLRRDQNEQAAHLAGVGCSDASTRMVRGATTRRPSAMARGWRLAAGCVIRSRRRRTRSAGRATTDGCRRSKIGPSRTLKRCCVCTREELHPGRAKNPSCVGAADRADPRSRSGCSARGRVEQEHVFLREHGRPSRNIKVWIAAYTGEHPATAQISGIDRRKARRRATAECRTRLAEQLVGNPLHSGRSFPWCSELTSPDSQIG